MNLITILIIYEIIPIALWMLGWYFENNYSKYPDTSKGYKSNKEIKDEKTWVYGNKVASKIFNITGTILFVMVAVSLLFFAMNLVLLAFIIFIVLCLDFMVIEGMIKKKFKN